MSLWSWDTVQSHLPHTTPIAALISIAVVSLYVFYRMFLLLFKPRAARQPRYTGDLSSSGLYHGSGVLALLNGNVYRGQFADGKFHGVGTYSFKATGTSYEGEFREGQPEGKGKEDYADGSVYVGEFRKGERDGEGRMDYGGDRGAYEGGWKAGRKHGQGRVQESKGGRWKRGVWLNGRLQKDAAKVEAGQDGDADSAAHHDKFILDDQLPPDVVEKENQRKATDAAGKAGKAH